MIDFLVYYKEVETDGIKALAETIITLEEIYDDVDLLEETLLEQLKEELDIECDVELISYESVVNYEVDVENLLIEDYNEDEY